MITMRSLSVYWNGLHKVTVGVMETSGPTNQRVLAALPVSSNPSWAQAVLEPAARHKTGTNQLSCEVKGTGKESGRERIDYNSGSGTGRAYVGGGKE